ncbi:hypothetical protein BRD17_04810 [Halobacteriales archaeon SW_7_68_16]|nr:MAG: hypothetical protein BRD17_04810 [Halobacteriales archaeon SW_7_68_16]
MSEKTTRRTDEEEFEEDVTADSETGTIIDLDAAESQESTDQLQQAVEEQQEQIDELHDLLTDLSARVADGNDTGVCPDCHGPVVRVGRWFRSDTIECRRCERVFHTY